MRHGWRAAATGVALVVAGVVGVGGSPVSAATDSGWTIEPQAVTRSSTESSVVLMGVSMART